MKPYYQSGGITIYHGDCREILPTLPPACVSFVLTDPPYGKTSLQWDKIIPFEFMWRELFRCTTKNSAIALFGAFPFSAALTMSNLPRFKYSLVWDKRTCSGLALSKVRPLSAHEDVLIFGEGRIKYNPQMKLRSASELQRLAHRSTPTQNKSAHHSTMTASNGNRYSHTHKFPTSVLRFTGVLNRSAEKVAHPTQKPLSLCRYLIKTYSGERELILDFSCGSGTTLIAAKNLERSAIGIEIEEKYCEIAAKRLQQEVLDFNQSPHTPVANGGLVPAPTLFGAQEFKK